MHATNINLPYGCTMLLSCMIEHPLSNWQAWSDTEGGLIRGAAAYLMDRFQRYRRSRIG